VKNLQRAEKNTMWETLKNKPWILLILLLVVMMGLAIATLIIAQNNQPVLVR
jgi:hypothetical protein